MPPLTEEQIAALLKSNTPAPRKAAQAVKKRGIVPPLQVGPLRYTEQDLRCVSRGCSSPCRIKVAGVPYCTTHALYALNEMYMALEGKYTFDECVCSAGKHSKFNMHTPDCPIFE